jgi:hypothetical protein
MQRKIQFMESFMNSLADVSFLLYPHHPYDLAILWDGKKAIAKPLIGFSLQTSYFKWKGKHIFLNNFREQDNGTTIPDWALNWVQDRIDKKSFKVDERMDSQDRFVLDGVIKKRKENLESVLSLYS